MKSSNAYSALAVAVLVAQVTSQCAPLLVDNYATWKVNNLNSFGGWTSDDGSMSSVTVTNSNLIVRAKAGSYFYETGFCENSLSDTLAKGWKGIQFSVQAPQGSQVALIVNLQTGCSGQNQANNYLPQPLAINAGENKTFTVDFTSFPGADIKAVRAISFEGFSPLAVDISFSPISFVCSPNQPPPPPPTCDADLIVEDMFDPQRLSFLGYNSLAPPGASGHDGTMASVVMSNTRLSLSRKDDKSYFYTQLNCLDVSKYAGISFPLTLPAGGTFSVTLEYSSSAGCSGSPLTASVNVQSHITGPTSGGERTVSIPFSSFQGINQRFINAIVFSSFTSPSVYRLGAIRLFCSQSKLTPLALPPADTLPVIPNISKPYPVGTGGTLVIEDFRTTSPTQNALGGWHGGEINVVYNANRTATLLPTGSGQSFYTQFVGFPCSDLSRYRASYLHIIASIPSGQDFEIVLEQQNQFCSVNRKPSPATFSQVSASVYRVGTTTNIYIPLSHFNIAAWNRIGSLALRGFRTQQRVVLSRVQIVNTVPSTVTLPGKRPEAPLVFECSVPNTVAFGIDDGDPALAPTVFKILREENVKATFFLLGNPLLDPRNGLATIYKQAVAEGHQIGFHSYSHPFFPTLVSNWEVDRQLNLALQVIQNTTGAPQPTYFRAPFGVVDSRLRHRLAVRNMKLIQWSIDVEDYLWGTSSTPEKQLEAFNRDLNAGGSLAVTHYLYNSTANYLRDFIRAAKNAGKRVVRIDQCLGDPSAPPI